MANEESSPPGNASPLVHDILGIKAFGEIGLVLTKGVVDEASDFLNRICGPAADELGDWGREEIQNLRKRRRENAIRIAESARRVVEATQQGEVHAPPRLVSQIIETGSWSEEEELQQMWAGLLASACTPEGLDDSNIIFTDLLSRMTLAQVRLLHYICAVVRKHQSLNKIKFGTMAQKDTKLQETMQVATIDDVGREVEFMRSLGLIRVLDLMPRKYNELIDITPSKQALRMYMRCQGFKGGLEEFYISK